MDEGSVGHLALDDFVHSLPDIGGGLRSKALELTPHLAQLLLDSQSHNRHIKRDLVDRLARDIREGRWQLNAQPILLDSEGHLGDGQHRCQAVIQAQIAVQVVVTYGIAPTAFPTLDSGRSRTPADLLSLKGEKATGNLTAALNLISLDKRGAMKRNRWSEAATNPEREQLLEEHPEIRDSVAVCEKAKAVISVGILAYVYWRGHQVAESLADVFVEALATGANLSEDNPAFVLRETLLRNKGSRNKKLQRPVVVAYSIKAFNAFLKQEPMRMLSWKAREDFPEFISREQLDSFEAARTAISSLPTVESQPEVTTG
jgi:hypothetical protein